MIEAAFVGVLGRDAEVKTSAKGTRYLKLNARVGDGDGAEWVSVLAFDEAAVPMAERFVEGKISLNEWNDQDGEKRHGLALMASHCRLAQIGRRNSGDLLPGLDGFVAPAI
jgi:single-stranded DNA-binding protein